MTRASIAAAALVLCGAAGAQDAPTSAGIHELTLPGSEHRYTVSIPRGYTGRDPVPLVVSLHFGGEVTPFFGRGLLELLVEPALRELRAIVVAPDAAAAARGWANPESEKHVLELVEHIVASYNIDTRRTLLTGYSMGGMGTWYLAPRHPEIFRAAIPMAGRPQDLAASFEWATPMYVIHSTADELIPLEPTETLVAELRARNAPVQLTVVDGITHFQMAGFQRHLRAAVPWIRETWARD
jgi:predicted peptidase